MEQLITQVQQFANVPGNVVKRKAQTEKDEKSDFGQALEQLAAYNVQTTGESNAQPETVGGKAALTVEALSENQLLELMNAVTFQELAKMSQNVNFGQVNQEEVQLLFTDTAALTEIPAEETGSEQKGILLEGSWIKAEGDELQVAQELLNSVKVPTESNTVDTGNKADSDIQPLKGENEAKPEVLSAFEPETETAEKTGDSSQKFISPEALTKGSAEYHVTDVQQLATEEVSDVNQMKAEYADMIKDMIAKQVSSGKQELEIQLTPRSLGDLTIKVNYMDGSATVSIICTDKKALQAMSQKAEELARILETNLGSRTEVVVESQKEQARLYEDGRGQQQSYNGQQSSKEQQPEKRQNETEVVDFLQQLRLGIRKENGNIWQ